MEIGWSWLGRRPYGEVLRLQRRRREEVISGESAPTLWLLEHHPVVTEGRRPAPGTPTPEELARRGIDWFKTERGGLATYHGPGQLVGYLVAPLDGLQLTVRGVVDALEAGLISWLADQGITAHRREGFPGVWAACPGSALEATGEGKLAAVGLSFKRGVSMHGFALNLDVDLGPFSLIVPCGIAGSPVLSVKTLLGTGPSPEDAAPSVADAVLAALGARCRGAPGPCPEAPASI